MGKGCLFFLFFSILPSRVLAGNVTSVSVVTVTTTTLSFSWSIPSTSTPTIVFSSNNFTATISSGTGLLAQASTQYAGLTPNTTYYFEVKNSTETDVSYITATNPTDANPPVAGSPGTTTPTTIVTNWGANGNSGTTRYEVQSATMSSFLGLNASSFTVNTSARLGSLSASTTYFFRVRAIGHSGTLTSFVTLSSASTTNPPNPTSVTVTENTLRVAAVTGGNVTALAYDPNNSNTVYAGVTGGGIYKSANDGSSWSQIFLPTLGSHSPNHVLISSHTANLLLVCERTTALIWRSADGGGSFSNVLANSADTDCHVLAEGINSNTFYASISERVSTNPLGHIYKSADNGNNWSALAVSTAGAFVSEILQLPNGRLLAGTQVYISSGGATSGTPITGGMYYSDDDGTTWTQATGSTQAVLGLAFNGGNTILAASQDGSGTYVSSSTDGSSWSTMAAYSVNLKQGIRHTLRYHPGSDTFFFLGPNLYQSASSTGSYSWPANNSPGKINGLKEGAYSLALGAPVAFVPDPDNANTLLGAAAGDGIFKTTDGGANWDLANTGLYSPSIEITLKSPTSGYIYAASRQGFVYFSTGTLNTWTRVYRPTGTITLYTIAYDQSDNRRMYISISTGGDNSGSRLLANNNLLTTTEDIIPFSHTGWQEAAIPGGGAPFIFALLANGSTVYAGSAPNRNSGSGQYLYRSTDSAATWTQLGLTTVGGIRSLAFDPSDRAVIYAGAGDHKDNHIEGTSGNGIFKSTDSGSTWTQLTALSSEIPRKIVVDTTTVSHVWSMAIQTGGNSAGPYDVWESLDSGTNWTKISPTNGSAAGYGISDISYIPSAGVLLASLPGSGTNIIMMTPGSCSGPCSWSDAFGVYGTAQSLYSGSVGIGSSSGIFENTNFSPSATSTPGSNFSNVKAYPNPLRPAKGHTVMHIINLPASANVKIYTLAGELLNTFTADSTGAVIWNGTNQSGNKVASGVYFVLGESGGGKRIIKVAVQR